MKTKSYLYCYKIIYLTFIILLLTVSTESVSTEKFSDYKKYEMIKTKFSLSEVTKGINFGWGMTFIDEHSLLITEKNGTIIKVDTVSGNITNIKHNLNSTKSGTNLFSNGQGGLLDILFHDGFIYISYSNNV